MIFRSPYRDIDVPDVSLSQFILARAAKLGDRPALIDGPSGRCLTYAELAHGVSRVAAALAARGVGRGDVLGLFAPNSPEFALAFFGAIAAGGVVTTLNSLATEQDVANQLRDAKARFLVVAAPFLERALPAAEQAAIAELFVLGEPGLAGRAGHVTPFSALLERDAPAPQVAIDPARDLAVLPYSSGTTGFPKGVMLTHRNVVANVLQVTALWQGAPQEHVIAVLPFFHIFGLTVALNAALATGASLVTMPRFELEPFLGLLEKYRITRAFVVPPLVLALAKHPAVSRYDLTSLNTVACGAAPLEVTLQTTCAQRLGCKVAQGYGLTEASPVTHATCDAPGKNRSGTIGELVPNTECRIVDVATRRDLGPGEDGELWVRGPQVMRGYLNDVEATAAMLDADGWLHTGDIGRADADGYFTIVDRLKELIKYKGYQVAPAELEAVLRAHPAVADAAVIPIPDAEAGEVPKAFVVLAEEVRAEELIAYVAERVAPYKKLHAVEVIEAIPKSPSGKILRRVLKERNRTVQA